ncbi:LLM class flavin-dependent oxidoreductase [Nocardioides sp. LHD-245]|uniref:LLM class flavin-dependent oxidoreductase n=1 Tax=Nocardioides sp. LHD-245 TaxID=3051387 RepID=UPI0027DF357F|nr:LLM class flavin-dependent oxidoreductase [Nocardioides sp. LHD-245]
MDLGIACSFRATGGESLGAAIARAGATAEQAGLASWWAGGDREAATDRAHDPSLGLQRLARATSGIRLGLSGDLLSLHSAAVRAKQIASIDWFAGGRLELGLDLGAPPAELADPFRDVDDHVGRALDNLGAMRALWTERRASYDGEHVSFTGAIALPKPVGERVPATHLRATSADALDRYAAAHGAPAGWLAWQAGRDDLIASIEVLGKVLGDAADGVRRTWCVPVADLPAAREAIASLPVRVDELVADLDHLPTDEEIAAIAAFA